MKDNLVNAEAIHTYLIEQVEYWRANGLCEEENKRLIEAFEVVIHKIEIDLDQMIDDMCRESQERARQIEIRLEDAYGNTDKYGDIIAGGSF